MGIFQKPSTLPSGIGPKSPTTLTHQYKNMIDQELLWKCQGRIPRDIPMLLGIRVITTTFLDANLLHGSVTGKSVTAVLHFINTTPMNWYSKRQVTVETATYGSEFVAARTATEQIMDLRNTLRYLGVPIMAKLYMFGDNKSVITSATIPQSVLNKRHKMLSYHRVREAIAAKILAFFWCSSDQNKSDILSKHWEHSIVKDTIRELFDYQGDVFLLKPD